MKKQIISYISVVFAILFIICCDKDESGPKPGQNEGLLYAEEAFPGIAGEVVSVELNGKTLTCELINGLNVYQGDIILSPDAGKGTKGTGISLSKYKWPYGVVYYEINNNLQNKQRFADAIDHWEDKTDIVFLERADEKNYIEFMPDPIGCYSNLGMQGGRQEIHIADWGNAGTIVHEIGHALGLFHEQSKSNRNDYVTILWDNIIPGKEGNFEICPADLVVETEGFDFNSLMLYHSWGFSKQPDNPDPLPTMTKLDGSTFTAARDILSEKDVEVISQMYSDLHDPVFEFSFGDMQGNAHIAFDGTYYYTVGFGRGRINKFNNKYQKVNSYTMPLIQGRGLSYNNADGFLYASIHGGHIIKITDLGKGIIDTVYRDLMQHPEAAFALSDDGEKLFDFYNGTVKIYDFVTGKLITTLTGLSSGKSDWDEIGWGDISSIAVDYSYIYTWDAWEGIVYVYNHKGVLQRSLQFDIQYRRMVGYSLSVINGYLFAAWDPNYDPGYWYVHNIRNPIKEE